MAKKLTVSQLLLEQKAIVVLLFTLIAALFWIGSSIYFAYSASTVTKEETIVITPFDAKIDTKVFDTLAKRKWWSQEELDNFAAAPQVSPSPTPSLRIPTASASADLP